MTIFKALNQELDKSTGGEESLDSLLPLIVDSEVDLASLVQTAEQVTGKTPDTLHIDKLPGCRNMP